MATFKPRTQSFKFGMSVCQDFGTKKMRSDFFFRLGRLKTLVLKTHFVREVSCFLRAGHNYEIMNIKQFV